MPMTLVSFMETRPPAFCGVASTPAWTTVSIPSRSSTLRIVGFRMSLRTNAAPPSS